MGGGGDDEGYSDGAGTASRRNISGKLFSLLLISDILSRIPFSKSYTMLVISDIFLSISFILSKKDRYCFRGAPHNKSDNCCEQDSAYQHRRLSGSCFYFATRDGRMLSQIWDRSQQGRRGDNKIDNDERKPPKLAPMGVPDKWYRENSRRMEFGWACSRFTDGTRSLAQFSD